MSSDHIAQMLRPRVSRMLNWFVRLWERASRLPLKNSPKLATKLPRNSTLNPSHHLPIQTPKQVKSSYIQVLKYGCPIYLVMFGQSCFICHYKSVRISK